MLSGHPPRFPTDRLSLPQWYAVRTRARAEKKVETQLASTGVDAFAAVAQVERRWRELSEVLATFGVAGVVRTGGVPARLREHEIDSVRSLAHGVTETGAYPEPADYLEPGEPVRVTEGPFQRMEGVLQEVRRKRRVAVRLPALRQAVAVELPVSALRLRRSGRNRRESEVLAGAR